MKIYDCFPFFNEIELLEWRLKILYDVVDCFVITEMGVTFQNTPKDFIFEKNIEMFKPYMEKIRYIKIDDTSKALTKYKDLKWGLEYYQRDYLKKGLYDCDDDDVILISDVDEFPDPRVLKGLKNSEDIPMKKIGSFKYIDELQGIKPRMRIKNMLYIVGRFKSYSFGKNIYDMLEDGAVSSEQEMYMFYINYKRPSNLKSSIIVRYKNSKIMSFSKWRKLRNILPTIENGWHFSYLGGVDKIITKLNSTSDGKTNPIFKIKKDERKKYIEKSIERGECWFHNDEKFICLNIENMDVPKIEWFANQYKNLWFRAKNM